MYTCIKMFFLSVDSFCWGVDLKKNWNKIK